MEVFVECRSCQQELAASSNFCAYCGADLRDSARPESSAAVRHQAHGGVTVLEPTAPPNAPSSIHLPHRSHEQRPTQPHPPLLRDCPTCTAVNSAWRSRCGRCEADLDSGEIVRPQPAWVIELDEEPAPSRERRPLGRMALAALVVAAALAGSAIGAAAWSEQRSDRARPVFDAGVYRSDPVPLPVAGVAAPGGEPLRDGPALIDADTSTAWSAAEFGTGVGETVLLHFDEPVWVGELSFWAPADGTGSRASRLGVETSDGEMFEVVLEDVAGEQAVELPDPVLVRTVRFEVRAAHPGTGSVRIAGIELRGWPAKGVDRGAV